MAKINKVLYNIDQTGDTSSVEKRTARNNIGCPSIITSTNTLPPVETDINTLTFKTDSRVYADNNVIGNIAPNPGQTDAGKFLVAQWAGSPAIGTYGLAAINQLPASTVADKNKVLTVNDNGFPVWQTGFIMPAFGDNKSFTLDTTTADEYEYSYTIPMPTGDGWDDLSYAGMQYTIYVTGVSFDPTEKWDVKINGSNWTTGIHGNFSTYTCNIISNGITFTVITSHNISSVRMSYIIFPQLKRV